MKKNRLVISLILFAVLFSGCSAKMSSSEAAIYDEKGYSEEMSVMEAPAMEEVSYDSGAVPSYNVERVVIKNADLSLVVLDPVTALETISQMADEKGGFVVNSNVYKVTSSSGKELPAATVYHSCSG